MLYVVAAAVAAAAGVDDDDFYSLALSRALQLKLIFKYTFLFILSAWVAGVWRVCVYFVFFAHKRLLTFHHIVRFISCSLHYALLRTH